MRPPIRAFVLVGIALLSVFPRVAGAKDKFTIPTNEEEVESFLQKTSEGAIELGGIERTYALPKPFKLADKEIIYLTVRDGLTFLASKGSDSIEYPVVRAPESIDLLIKAKTLGDVLAAIATSQGKDGWALLPPTALVAKETSTSDAMLLPLRFCYVANQKLFFFSALYPLKRTAELVSGAEKPIGDNGPLRVRVEAVNLFLAPDI